MNMFTFLLCKLWSFLCAASPVCFPASCVMSAARLAQNVLRSVLKNASSVRILGSSFHLPKCSSFTFLYQPCVELTAEKPRRLGKLEQWHIRARFVWTERKKMIFTPCVKNAQKRSLAPSVAGESCASERRALWSVARAPPPLEVISTTVAAAVFFL